MIEEKKSVVFSVSMGVGCYRHICVSASRTLEDFADIILSAFGFINDHAHMFCMDNHAWSFDDCYWEERVDLEEEHRHTCDYSLSQLGFKKGDQFKMIFDFGDDWRFQCKVLRLLKEDVEDVDGARVLKEVGRAPKQYNFDWD